MVLRGCICVNEEHNGWLGIEKTLVVLAVVVVLEVLVA